MAPQAKERLFELGNLVGSVALMVAVFSLMGLAALPGGLLVVEVHARYGLVAALLSLPFGYAAFGVALCGLTVVVKRALGSLRPGDYPLVSIQGARWAVPARLVDVCHRLFVHFFTGTPLVSLWFALLGAKVGRRAMINTLDLSDWDLLQIGDDAILGAGSVVIAHVAEQGRLRLAPVVIGAGATVGRDAIVLPGAKLGEGAVLGAQSLLAKGKAIPNAEVWVGAPAELARRRGARRAAAYSVVRPA